jgi:hypothetical protein
MLAAVSASGDHVRRNRAVWDRWAADYAEPGLRLWVWKARSGDLGFAV